MTTTNKPETIQDGKTAAEIVAEINATCEGKPVRHPDYITEDIKRILSEDDDLLADVLEELDDWNGYLNDDRYYTMDCLGDVLSGMDKIELLNRAYYGKDLMCWHIDRDGEKHFESFNPNRAYFRFNGYGNLESTNYRDYSDHLDEYTIKALSDYYEECRFSCDIPAELLDLFDEMHVALYGD